MGDVLEQLKPSSNPEQGWTALTVAVWVAAAAQLQTHHA
jgi:hypothetical protein